MVLFFAGNVFSSWDIWMTNRRYEMSFDEDIQGVYHARNERSEDFFNIGEPGCYARLTSDRGGILFSESAASSHRYLNGDGTEEGASSRFLMDSNLNGQSNDQNIGSTQMGVRDKIGPDLGSCAYKLSIDNDMAWNGVYFRIRNKTGVTVTQWTFSATIYYGEPDHDGRYSELTYSYAVDSGTNPNEMSFIPFGTAPRVSAGAVITRPAGELNETVMTAPVANGDYIVLVFHDKTGDNGSDVYLDNIGIVAVEKKVAQTVFLAEDTPMEETSAAASSGVFSTEVDYSTRSGTLILSIGGLSFGGLLLFAGIGFFIKKGRSISKG